MTLHDLSRVTITETGLSLPSLIHPIHVVWFLTRLTHIQIVDEDSQSQQGDIPNIDAIDVIDRIIYSYASIFSLLLSTHVVAYHL